MTRNQRRAQFRQANRSVGQSESRIGVSGNRDVSAPALKPDRQAQTSRKLKTSEMERLMRHDIPRNRKPRQTWNQPGWSEVSPFYRTMATIDRRWDK